jgi:hypothetical protein
MLPLHRHQEALAMVQSEGRRAGTPTLMEATVQQKATLGTPT